jgi:hypothetical protein
MPTFTFTSPEGKKFKVTGPEGSTKEQAFEKFKAMRPELFQKPSAVSEIPIRQVPVEIEEPTAWEAARPYVAPTAEMLGGLGGAALGSRAGLPGTVLGGGLGYAAAKQALEAADVAFGRKVPLEGAQAVLQPAANVAEGALFEMLGPYVGKAISTGVGKAAEFFSDPARAKAATIMRQSLGPDVEAARNALMAAPEGRTVQQVISEGGITSPTTQALIERATAAQIQGPRANALMAQQQEQASLNALAELAEGRTAAETKAYQDAVREFVNRELAQPALEKELGRANVAGQLQPKLSRMQEEATEAASRSVEDVRRFTAAGERAMQKAGEVYPVRGMPKMPVIHTYPYELAQRAERVAQQAADASLDFGQARVFAGEAMKALDNQGLKPLKGEQVIPKLQEILRNPKYAGNEEIEKGVSQVISDISDWTKSGGVIDAWALDAIRKNSVNKVTRALATGSKADQNRLASKIMGEVNPLIVDAIEEAGGKGYGQYLKSYSNEMSKLAEKKLAGEALSLWKTNKDAFVRLVQNESPEEVERILGPGNYDIAKSLSEGTLQTLEAEARKILTKAKIKSEVSGGQDALKELLLQNISKFRLPSYLSALTSTTNKGLQVLEDKIGKKTMTAIAKASESPEKMIDLLNTLPPQESNRVLKLISTPSLWNPVSRAAPAVAAGASEENRDINKLRRAVLLKEQPATSVK